MRIFVLFCVFLGGLGQGIVNPKLPELLIDHTRLALDSGISASLMYAGIFFASFLFGKMADNGYSFRLIAACLFAYAAVLFLFCVARSREAVFLLRLAEGLSLCGIYISADAVLCRASADHERGRWLSYYGIALSVGLLLGPALSLMLESLSVREPLANSLTFVGLIALGLGCGSLFFRMPKWSGEMKQGIRNRGATLAASLYGFLEAGLVAVLAAVVVGSFHSKVEHIFLFMILSAALASLLWGTLIDKWGARPTLFAVFFTLALSMGMVALAQWQNPSEWVLFASAASFGMAAGGIYPAGFAWLIEGSHPSQYGYASGLFARAYGLGSLFGPLCFGLAVDRAGALGFFPLAALLGIFGMIFSRKASQE